MYDAVIIGAGMSGLAAGIRLAHFGQRVCICERHYAIGGLNSFYRLNRRDYDVGLHAVTNFAPRGVRLGPLAKILRQLRLSWDDFGLVPQRESRIVFPGAALRFNNDIDLLVSQVAERFPTQSAAFQRLLHTLLDYDAANVPLAGASTRGVLAEIFSEPLLADMLLAPVMYYGAAGEDDLSFGQFSVLFRSIFLEGLGRPPAGIRPILKVLQRRFKELGGELRLRSGVRQIVSRQSKATGVVLDDGRQIEAARIFSSAGWCETMRFCDQQPPESSVGGRLSFVESINWLDAQPAELGIDPTMVFFSATPELHWRQPDKLVDYGSGVICIPGNYAYPAGTPLQAGHIRTTVLANYDRWQGLTADQYRAEKERVADDLAGLASEMLADFRGHVVERDTFTPTTIRHFTGHDNGAVYGSPEKHPTGRTHLENLFVCGTDQGLVGIVGALLSGILMANAHGLAAATRQSDLSAAPATLGR